MCKREIKCPHIANINTGPEKASWQNSEYIRTQWVGFIAK